MFRIRLLQQWSLFIFIVNIFRALLRAHFKMSLSRAQNIFIPKNINTIAITITLDGISEINTEQMTTKHSEEHFFFTSAVKKRQQTLKGLLDFDWLHRSYDYLILT